MHVTPENYMDLFKPPQHILDQCVEVVFYDIDTPPWRMKKWCRANNLSLIWFEFLDLADLSSSIHDSAYLFYFIDEHDATMFRLKFQ